MNILIPVYTIDGDNPAASLYLATNGVLYGTTSAGGDASCAFAFVQGCGTVFSITLP